MLRASSVRLVSLGCALLTAPVTAAWGADFERDVAPFLVRRCVSCHNASEPAGGLDLSQRGTARTGGESGLAAIVAGSLDDSYLLERIRAGEMPPEGKGTRATAAEVAGLETWIAQGAAWPNERVLGAFEFTSDVRAGRDWWSLQALEQVAVPGVKHADRVRNAVDAFVLAQLERHGLQGSQEADRATYIRRASLDLLGLAPSPEEVREFVLDTAANAYERLVDRLLASPRYGERWARHWLDVVRFGESNGYETNTERPTAWPYRDWLIRSLNDDIAFGPFVLAQLAGDQVGFDAATGFLVGGAHDTVGSPDIELTLAQRMNDLDDMISTTASAFLGLTVGCARCHDHKFDPIAQRDYYALQAVFAGVQHGQREVRTKDWKQRERRQSVLAAELASLERRSQASWARHQPLATVTEGGQEPLRPAVNARWNVDRFAPVETRYVRFTVLATNQLEPCLDELEVLSADEPGRNLAAAALGAKATASSVYADGRSSLHKLRHANDGRYGNGASWISAEVGGGWLQIELAELATIDCVVWARDREDAYRDRLATRYKIETSTDAATWQTAATSDDRTAFDPGAKAVQGPGLATQGLPSGVAEEIERWRSEADALRAQIDALATPKIYAGTFVEPEATHVLYRGEPLQKRQQVAPGAIAAVAPPLTLAADTAEARRRLALAHWIARPDNPLSARVMVNRVWYYHFGQGLVKTPSDFGYGGGLPSHPQLLDWLACEFLARGGRLKPLHRLIMLSSTYRQASRSNAQAAATDAGNRLLWRFAPRRLEAEPIRDNVLLASGALDLRMGGPGYDVFEPNTNYVKVYAPKQRFGPAEWRRMVYQNKPRMRQDATFGEFDCPDSSQTMARRNVSTTALQALNLLNGPFMIEQAGLFAARLQRETGDDVESQVRRAFWLAFGRDADDDEIDAARALIDRRGLLVFCRALYNANEFIYSN